MAYLLTLRKLSFLSIRSVLMLALVFVCGLTWANDSMAQTAPDPSSDKTNELRELQNIEPQPPSVPVQPPEINIQPGDPTQPIHPDVIVVPPATITPVPVEPVVPVDPSIPVTPVTPTTPVVPVVPSTPVVPITPVIPGAPEKISPTEKEKLTPVPVVPTVPITPVIPTEPGKRVTPVERKDLEKEKVVPPVTVVPVVPVKPEKEQEKKGEKPLNPGSFLVTTPDPEQKKPKEPEKKEKTDKAKKEKVEKAEPKGKPAKPNKTDPKEKAKEKPEPKKAPQKAKKGAPLQIPEESRKTGSLDFLEGCWVGTRPEYVTKRTVVERFCFGKNGVGKRYITDRVAGTCVGATRAVLNKGGVLQMRSQAMSCSSGANWAGSDMVCKGQGARTPCSWVFHGAGGGRQAYHINFVKE